MNDIRPADPKDARAIAALWNAIIRGTDITFNPVEKSDADILDFLADHAAKGDPVLVLERDGEVRGFAAYHPFRAGLGYSRTREVSINLAPSAQGSGHGKRLMQALEMQAKETDVHVLVAGITATNSVSRAFFASLGYIEVGTMPQVGWKFERWHDLVLMQKIL